MFITSIALCVVTEQQKWLSVISIPFTATLYYLRIFRARINDEFRQNESVKRTNEKHPQTTVIKNKSIVLLEFLVEPR